MNNSPLDELRGNADEWWRKHYAGEHPGPPTDDEIRILIESERAAYARWTKKEEEKEK